MQLLDDLLGYQRLTIPETDRAIVLHKGRFTSILSPGEHRLPKRDMVTDVHSLARPQFTSGYEAALFRERPDLAAAHRTEVRAGADEVVIVSRDGRLHEVVRPEARAVYWTDAGPWATETHSVTDGAEVPDVLGLRLQRAGLTGVVALEVPEGHVGFLTVDGVQTRTLPNGTHRFWATGRKIAVKPVDLRWRTRDVTG